MIHVCGATIPDESTYCNTCGKKIVYDGLTTKLDIPEYRDRPNPTASGIPAHQKANTYVLRMDTLEKKVHTIEINLTHDQRESLLESLRNLEVEIILLRDYTDTPHIIRKKFLENCIVSLYLHPQGNKR